MDKNTNDNSIQNNGAMSTAKTNEDHNKQKPDPNNPNQTKHHQIGEEEEKENHERAIEAEMEMPEKNDTQNGNEGNEGDLVSDKNSKNLPVAHANLSGEEEKKQKENTKIHSTHHRENENREEKTDSMRAQKISQPEDASTGKL